MRKAGTKSAVQSKKLVDIAGQNNTPVKALIRGLEVLASVNDSTPATVTWLVEQTGYPKATVIRLLQTLCREDYVEEVDDGRGYRVRPKVLSLSRGLSTKQRYHQACEQPMKDLGIQLKWPAEFLLRDGHSMAIEFSNRSTAPIKVQVFERSRFPLLESASGIAWLSALGEQEAREIVQDTVDTVGISEEVLENPVATIMERIVEARKKGYVYRSYDVLSPDMRIVAIPLAVADRPTGAISLIHYAMYIPETLMRKTVVPGMRHAAELIGHHLEAS